MKKLILIASACALLAACGGASLPDPTATPFPDPPAELMRPAQELKTLEPHAPG
jgi:hypothetical protein